VVLPQVLGRPLTQAIFDEAMPCTAESLIMLLDSLPAAVVALPRRPPWTGAVATYAEMIAAALPALDPQLRVAGWASFQRPCWITAWTRTDSRRLP
jgi:hypothetical protein